MSYCAYCGRVAHRCECAAPHSALQRFLAAGVPSVAFVAQWRTQPYKRGVPPQVKRAARTALARQRGAWLALLSARYGAACMHCGAIESLVLDHILPIAKGGTSTLENVQLLCARCNTLKGKLMFDCRPP